MTQDSFLHRNFDLRSKDWHTCPCDFEGAVINALSLSLEHSEFEIVFSQHFEAQDVPPTPAPCSQLCMSAWRCCALSRPSLCERHPRLLAFEQAVQPAVVPVELSPSSRCLPFHRPPSPHTKRSPSLEYVVESMESKGRNADTWM